MKHLKKRRALIDTARKMQAVGLNQGTSGNLCVRISSGLLITPSGIPYDALAPEDIVAMRLDGTVEPGQRKPSSEWRFHAAILATRPEAKAVVHCHSMFATTLGCLRRDIPAFHYMIATAGGDSIRCAEYATFGTKELSDNALKALDGRRACLLANHGMIAFGADLEGALALAIEVETLAAQYWRALQIGDPVLLPPEEMAVVLDKFRDYGR
jgi:L-fuculose-phosphate aldolase